VTVTMREGGIYRDREGTLHGPVKRREHSKFKWLGGHYSWDDAGLFNGVPGHRFDLMEEIGVATPVAIPRANWAEASDLLRHLTSMGASNKVASVVGKGHVIPIPEGGQELLHAAAVQAIKQRLSQLGVEVE